MEILISVLMLFVALNCATKLSLWNWWQRFAFSALLAAFVVWSQRYAVLQSKTQLADLLQNVTALQNMAVIVTIESAINFAFCACWFGDAYEKGEGKGMERRGQFKTQNSKFKNLLKWYASLLVFPVAFYILTQTMFAATGVDFDVTSVSVAVAMLVLLPLLAEGIKWFITDNDERVELHALFSCFVCILGLTSTVTSKMVYRANESPIDWRMVAMSIVVFAVLFIAGYFGAKLKWKLPTAHKRGT